MYLIFILIFTAHFCSGLVFKDCNVQPKELTDKPKQNPGKYSSYSLDYYYHNALRRSAVNTFTDVFLAINLTDQDAYHFYQGNNCSVVNDLHDSDSRYFGIFKKAAILRSHQISPFENTIVGISTSEPYEISVTIFKVNYLRVALFAFAILLFLFAGSLVRNVVFYYASGCSFGLLSSLLLVAFIVYRVAPKKTIGIPILIGGWSVSLYMLNFAWTNLTSIMIDYQRYVIGYFSLVILISMGVCYKRGPPTDARAHDIAQWSLQIVALVILYFTSQLVEITTATYIVLFLQQLTKGWLAKGVYWYFVGLKTFWRTIFPKQRKLLTQEEYEEEGREFTKSELAKLKRYCRENADKSWQMVGNVKASRRPRLARFVQGEAKHITGREEYEYEVDTDSFLMDYDDEEQLEHSREYEDEEDEEFEEEWDEVVVKRKGGGARNTSIQSIRVPRSVTSRLLNRSAVAADRSFNVRAHYTPFNRPSLGGASSTNMYPRRHFSEQRPIYRPEVRTARKEREYGRRSQQQRAHNGEDESDMVTPLPTHEFTFLEAPRSTASNVATTASSSRRRLEPRPTKSRRSMQPGFSESDDEEKVY